MKDIFQVSLWLSKSECTRVLALPQNLPWASVTRDLLDQIHKPTSPFYKQEQVFLFGCICICIVFVFVVAIVQWSQQQWDQLRCYHKPTLITSLHRNLNLSICNRPGQPSFHSTKTFWTCIISSRYNKQNVKPQKILPWSKYRRRDQISSTGFVVRIFILS